MLDHIPSEKLMRDFNIEDGWFTKKSLLWEQSERLRIAVVSVHGIKCGIATYTEFLCRELRPLVKDLCVFAEEHDDQVAEDGVVYCWKRGESAERLAQAIQEYDPHVVFIQHEYGLFPRASVWLSLLSQLHFTRVVVTLHSVYPHHPDKIIDEAACREIIVHTERAKENLAVTKSLSANIFVIPHGTFESQGRKKLWNRYQTRYTLLQFGFGFPYKGWENSIAAVSRLKEKYPDVFFTGLFSESPHSAAVHEKLHSELQAEVLASGVRDNVAIVRGFQSETVLDSYLKVNRIGIFPYCSQGTHTVYASSGAVLVAMAKGLPCIVSDQPLFDHLEGVCPRVGNVEELVAAIEALFSESALSEQLTRQEVYLKANAWPVTAARYVDSLRLPEVPEAAIFVSQVS